MQARLFTRSGGYVATVRQVPSFHIPPEMIAWGSRFFVHQPDGTYTEGMVWAAFDINFEAAVPDRSRSPHEALTRREPAALDRAADATFEGGA